MAVPQPATTGGTRLALGIAALAAAVLLAESWAQQPQIDDSFITYRYADNLLNGAGLVWIPGERIEAITNLLWALLVAAGGALGAPATLAGHALGVVSGIALLLATGALAMAGVSARARPIAALAPWVVLASPALPYFATSGMETNGFLALTVGALAAHAHGRVRIATGLLCLAIAIRPDAGIVAAAVLAVHLLEAGPLRARSWLPVAAVAAAVAAVTIFRLAYYGSPVPNTFHAKVGGIPLEMALQAAGHFLLEAPVCLVLPALLALRGDLRALAPVAACLGTLLYVVSSGGTAMTFSRFLSPLLPVLAALAARTAAQASERGDRLAPLWLGCLVASAAGYLAGPLALGAAVATGAVAAAAALTRRWPGARAVVATGVVAVVAAGLTSLADEHVSRSERVRSKREFDRKLRDGATRKLAALRAAGVRPGSLVGATAIGVVGYYGEYPILDLLGLADPVIARSSDAVSGAVLVGQGHVRSNASYVLDRRPEVLLIGQRGGRETRTLTAVRALWEHPELDRLYRCDPRIRAYRLRARPGRPSSR
jgi:hypothetical protein